MKVALQTANEMEVSGLIGKYSIAGSVAIIYYATPIATDDLDLFFLHSQKPDEIFSMQAIYEFLQRKGCRPENFTVWIGGVKVQFIPSTGALMDEAINKSQEVVLFGMNTRVVTPEYLIALKLIAGRPKDVAHIILLLNSSRIGVQLNSLLDVLKRYNIEEKWTKFLEVTQWKPKQ
ncbi:nucleotidyltransferase [bacterium]|nr:nucleotidyltransferase [bacterium]